MAFLGALFAEATNKLTAAEGFTIALTLLGAGATGVWWVATLHHRVTQQRIEIDQLKRKMQALAKSEESSRRRMWQRIDAISGHVAENRGELTMLANRSGISKRERVDVRRAARQQYNAAHGQENRSDSVTDSDANEETT